MEDTIVILRGIAERYASFHGVRISDRALVAAAELSARYIQARALLSLYLVNLTAVTRLLADLIMKKPGMRV